MTAQELYKVWAQEHADDLRGDWPIRFADYCLSVVERVDMSAMAAKDYPRQQAHKMSESSSGQTFPQVQVAPVQVEQTGSKPPEMTAKEFSATTLAQQTWNIFEFAEAYRDYCLSAANAALKDERKAHEEIADILLPLVGTPDGTSLGAVRKAVKALSAANARIAELEKALKQGRDMVLSAYTHVSHGGPTMQEAKSWIEFATDALSSPAAATAKEK